ncbi:hypothetical protein P0Y35_06660 [Kiritimatiellaeota bacterium B1221]|nr:hypothetical protein [Kiritimatiellaeota bacterium B1221]
MHRKTDSKPHTLFSLGRPLFLNVPVSITAAFVDQIFINHCSDADAGARRNGA